MDALSGISPRLREKKSYLQRGPTSSERKQSDQRKSTIKDSLGAFLRTNPAQNNGDNVSDPVNRAPVRKCRSGGALLSTMQASTINFSHRRNKQTKASSKIKASAKLDDAFIDALLGTTASPGSNRRTTSSSERGQRKIWQGIGLDQFKEKMGYKKTSIKKSSQRRSKSPLGISCSARTERTSFNAGSGSNTGDEADSLDCSDRASVSEYGLRRTAIHDHLTPTLKGSVDTSKSAALQSQPDYGSISSIRFDNDAVEDSAPPPPDEALLPNGPVTPRSKKDKRGKKPSMDDSFHGLEFDQALKDEGITSSKSSLTKRSPRTPPSQRRSRRSRSRDTVDGTVGSPKEKQRPSSRRHSADDVDITSPTTTPTGTPSATRRRKSLRHGISTIPLSCSVRSERSHAMAVDSSTGWADLQIEEDCLDENLSNRSKRRSETSHSTHQSLRDKELKKQVGDNLISIGVHLIARGQDLQSVSRRGSDSLAEADSLLSQSERPDADLSTHDDEYGNDAIDFEAALGMSLHEKLGGASRRNPDKSSGGSQRSQRSSNIICTMPDEDINSDIESLSGDELNPRKELSLTSQGDLRNGSIYSHRQGCDQDGLGKRTSPRRSSSDATFTKANFRKMEDSWRGLEFDFVDSHVGKGPPKKKDRNAGRSKSADGLETMRAATRGNAAVGKKKKLKRRNSKKEKQSQTSNENA